ncbi:hypothetical protein V6N11_034915, partial [Hibiscus sabdariffa]
MAVLASCWLIIESTVIPHGFFRRCRVKEDDDDSYVEADDNFSENQLIRFSVSSSIPSIVLKAELVEPQRGLLTDANGCKDFSFRLQEDLRTDECSSFFCCSSPSIDESYLNEYSPLFSSSNSPLMKACPLPARGSGSRVWDREMIATARDDDDESEVFYQKYSERMRWFDVLNHDRTQGIGAILNMEMGSPSSLEKIKLKDLTIPYISWSNYDKKKLLKSLQGDFELVYVAQSCLTWEALHHQYRKVKFLCFTNCFFADNLAKDFETFQLLLERFLDEEKYLYKGKRAWNYVQARHASKTLLQVPKITGYLEEEKEGETVDAKDVLKAIEKCIKAFGKFITMERNKAWWKFKSSLGTYPPMENPRDLQLLADLTTTLGRVKSCPS